MLKTDFTYIQLLEWDKYDLAEHILDLQDKIKELDWELQTDTMFYKAVIEGFKSKNK